MGTEESKEWQDLAPPLRSRGSRGSGVKTGRVACEGGSKEGNLLGPPRPVASYEVRLGGKPARGSCPAGRCRPPGTGVEGDREENGCSTGHGAGCPRRILPPKVGERGCTTPAAQRGPFSRKKTGNPAPGGNLDRKSRPGRPLTHQRPTHIAVWTGFTGSVSVAAHLHPRRGGRLRFVTSQIHGAER